MKKKTVFLTPFDRFCRAFMKNKRRYLKYKKHCVMESRKCLQLNRARRNHKSMEISKEEVYYSVPNGNNRLRQMR